jgi:uncharacterized delta-60 repeat protein
MVDLPLLSGRNPPSSARFQGVQLQFARLEDRVVPGGGALDQSFGQGGIVSTQMDGALGIAEQADGKLVVVSGYPQKFALIRYNADGTVDSTFGNSGIVALDFAHGAMSDCLLIQPDGKIVVGGAVQSEQSDMWGNRLIDFALARFNADGSLDTTFGIGGTVETSFAGFFGKEKIALQPDGHIILAGQLNGAPMVARFDADGTFDTAFGTYGNGLQFFRGLTGNIADLAVQPDGKILVLGRAGFGGWLARLNADGSPDSSFPPLIPISPKVAPSGLALQPDGRILVVGVDWAGVYHDPTGDMTVATRFVLGRFNSDGSPDIAFGHSGQVSIPFINVEESPHGVMVDQQGRIIVVGDAEASEDLPEGGVGPIRVNFNFILRRYDPQGALDSTFGDNGIVVTAAAVTTCSLIQTDGKIVVVGHNWLGVPPNIVLARYLGDTVESKQAPAIVASGPLVDASGLAILEGALDPTAGMKSTPFVPKEPETAVVHVADGPMVATTGDPAFLGGVFVG